MTDRRETAREDLMHRSFNAAIEQCAKIAESMPASRGTAIAKAIRLLLRQDDQAGEPAPVEK